MPKKKLGSGPTVRIEFKIPEEQKKAAEAAAVRYGDGDVSSWIRNLIRAELQRLGLLRPPDNGRKEGGRKT